MINMGNNAEVSDVFHYVNRKSVELIVDAIYRIETKAYPLLAIYYGLRIKYKSTKEP